MSLRTGQTKPPSYSPTTPPPSSFPSVAASEAPSASAAPSYSPSEKPTTDSPTTEEIIAPVRSNLRMTLYGLETELNRRGTRVYESQTEAWYDFFYNSESFNIEFNEQFGSVDIRQRVFGVSATVSVLTQDLSENARVPLVRSSASGAINENLRTDAAAAEKGKGGGDSHDGSLMRGSETENSIRMGFSRNFLPRFESKADKSPLGNHKQLDKGKDDTLVLPSKQRFGFGPGTLHTHRNLQSEEACQNIEDDPFVELELAIELIYQIKGSESDPPISYDDVLSNPFSNAFWREQYQVSYLQGRGDDFDDLTCTSSLEQFTQVPSEAPSTSIPVSIFPVCVVLLLSTEHTRPNNSRTVDLGTKHEPNHGKSHDKQAVSFASRWHW